ncbi:MAG: hypothetical protein WBP55_10520 [Solirubrobacterales bacterium]
MDPEKPDSKKKKEVSPAEKRVDALISGKNEDSKPEPGQASQRLQEQKKKATESGKVALTEKQRIEARRQRQAKKRRPVTGNLISRGLRAVAFEAQRTALFLGRSVVSGIDAIKPAFRVIAPAARSFAQLVVGWLILAAGLVARGFSGLGRLLLALDRVVTARRAFTLIALVAAGLLITSQFMDFRAIEIGQPGYVQVQDITRAPRTEVKTPIDTHSLFLVAIGILALGAAAATLLGRRRIAGLVLTSCGAVVLITGIAVDLPVALDVADAQLAYSGVKAILLAGFWLELAAGTVLLVSGLAFTLARDRNPSSVREPRRASSRVAGSSA